MSSDGWTTVSSSSRRTWATSSSSSSSSALSSRGSGFSESAARAFGSGRDRSYYGDSGRRSWKMPARGEAPAPKKPTMEEMFPALPGSTAAPVKKAVPAPTATSFAALVKKRADEDAAKELERKAAEEYERMQRYYEASERIAGRIHNMYRNSDAYRDTYDYSETVDYGVDDLDNYAPANEKKRPCISDDLPPELESSEDEEEAW